MRKRRIREQGQVRVDKEVRIRSAARSAGNVIIVEALFGRRIVIRQILQPDAAMFDAEGKARIDAAITVKRAAETRMRRLFARCDRPPERRGEQEVGLHARQRQGRRSVDRGAARNRRTCGGLQRRRQPGAVDHAGLDIAVPVPSELIERVVTPAAAEDTLNAGRRLIGAPVDLVTARAGVDDDRRRQRPGVRIAALKRQNRRRSEPRVDIAVRCVKLGIDGMARRRFELGGGVADKPLNVRQRRKVITLKIRQARSRTEEIIGCAADRGRQDNLGRLDPVFAVDVQKRRLNDITAMRSQGEQHGLRGVFG